MIIERDGAVGPFAQSIMTVGDEGVSGGRLIGAAALGVMGALLAPRRYRWIGVPIALVYLLPR